MSETVKDYGRGWGRTSWISECHRRSDRGRENARKSDADRRGRESGPQLPGFRWGWAGVFIRRVQDEGRQYMLRREGVSGEKERKRIEVQCCRRQTTQRRMRKGKSGDQRRCENVWYLNARQQAQSRKGVAGVGVRWQKGSSRS